MNFQQIKQFVATLFDDNSHQRNRFMLHQEAAVRGVVSSLVMPDVSRGWILDISHWNIPPVALKRMKDDFGLLGVIIKGCDGSLRARYSAQHVATANAAEVPFGFYEWLYRAANVSIDAQVNAWIAQAKEFQPQLGIAIDAEWTKWNGVYSNPTASDLRAAHDKTRIKWGESAITYTAKGYADQYLKGFDFSREPLWVASYGGTVPLMPLGARSWLMWQFTGSLDGKALDPAGNHELDGSYFNGDKNAFRAYFGLNDPLPPQTGPKLTARLNVYSDGSTTVEKI